MRTLEPPTADLKDPDPIEKAMTTKRLNRRSFACEEP